MNQPLTSHIHTCVAEFMRAFEQRIYPDVKEVPCEVSLLRSSLIKEESQEYANAAVNSVDELDAILDLLYVVIGTSVAFSVSTAPYRSGQIQDKSTPKQDIFQLVVPLTQNLDSMFPCAKQHYQHSSALVNRLIDIGTIRGYKLAPAFEAVHRANMGKLWTFAPEDKSLIVKVKGQNRFLVKRADGKVLKPTTFTPPDLAQYL